MSILCFGEMLLRLTPNNDELLMQSPGLTVRPGGAEANVAVSLARYGAEAAMATVLPDNTLGHAARDEVRKHGVDTRGIVFKPGRGRRKSSMTAPAPRSSNMSTALWIGRSC